MGTSVLSEPQVFTLEKFSLIFYCICKTESQLNHFDCFCRKMEDFASGEILPKRKISIEHLKQNLLGIFFSFYYIG